METTGMESSGAGGGIGILLLVYLVIIVLMIASMWKTFTKAGEPGWAAIIPIYNSWILVKISGVGAIWFVMMFVPFINLVALIITSLGIAKVFNKGGGFGIGLAFLSPIFYPILAFGDAQYVGEGGATSTILPPTDAGTPPGPFS